MQAGQKELEKLIAPKEEEVERDLDRVAEYQVLYPQYVFIEPQVVQLSTGLILAYRFADKVRRILFAVYGKVVPKEVILKSAAEINKRIYDILVEKGVRKTDVIRISFKAQYKPREQVIAASDITVERFLPEEEVKKCYDLLRELKKLIERIEGGEGR